MGWDVSLGGEKCPCIALGFGAMRLPAKASGAAESHTSSLGGLRGRRALYQFHRYR